MQAELFQGRQMNHHTLIHTAIACVAWSAACALAQTPAPTPVDPSPVVTDVGPAPAHDRSSIGAVVVDDSVLRPQRDRDFAQTDRRNGIKVRSQARKPAKSSSMGQSGRSSP